MVIKLTKADYEGYLSMILLKQKQYQMATDESILVVEWLKKIIKKFPSKK